MTVDKPLTIKADPGVYLVQLIKEESVVNTGAPKKRRVLKGKIIDVGPDRDHDQGGTLKSARKIGDIIWFFSYTDEDADSFEANGKVYHTVIFNDTRAHIEE